MRIAEADVVTKSRFDVRTGKDAEALPELISGKVIEVLTEGTDYTAAEPEMGAPGGSLSVDITEQGRKKMAEHTGCCLQVLFDTSINENAFLNGSGAGTLIPNDTELHFENKGTVKVKKNPYTPYVYTGEITVQKVSQETGEALSGAEFTLFCAEGTLTKKPVLRNENKSGSPTVITPDQVAYADGGLPYTAVSDADGKAVFTGLRDGTYYLRETRAPEGFQNDPDFGNGAKMLIGHVELNEAGRARFNVISGMDPVENTITVKDTPEPVPEIGTTLVNAEDGTHIVPADTDVELVDTVSYEDVTPGNTYTVTGTLMDKSTRKALQYNGKDVTATATFKADKAEGTVDVTFTFNTADLGGKSLVAFEQLSCSGRAIAKHEDWDDEGQTVTVKPNVLITTTLVNAEDGTHLVPADSDVELKDTISYEGVTPGETYTAEGTLMDKSTGRPFQAGGKDVTATVTFKPEKAEGTVETTFSFNTRGLNGKELVAFYTSPQSRPMPTMT